MMTGDRLPAAFGELFLRLLARLVGDRRSQEHRWEPTRRQIERFIGRAPPDRDSVLRESALTAVAFWLCERMTGPALRVMAANLVRFPVAVDDALARPGPVIVSVPHYGPFLLCAVALRGRLGERPVTILFQNPMENAGNARNDEILKRIYAPGEIGYDDRRGILRAVKTLKAGGLCVLMPDVTRAAGNTFFVPFLGGALQVQPGVATLARMTGARILPSYPYWRAGGDIGIDVGEIINGRDQDDAAQADFVCMSTLMGDFARQLRARPIGWVYWRLADRRIKPWNDAGQPGAVLAAVAEAAALGMEQQAPG